MIDAWDKQDLVSEWERSKNKRIEKIKGNKNKFIEEQAIIPTL